MHEVLVNRFFELAKNIKRVSECIIEPAHTIVVLMADSNSKGSDKPEHFGSLIRTIAAQVQTM